MIHGADLKFVTRVGKNGEYESPEAKRKVFISYRKKDNEFDLLERMVGYILKATDCAVWYDSSLTPGENYDEEISIALKECDAVVLLLTKDVLSSDYIWNIEIKRAVEYKKGIIPVGLGLPAEYYSKVTDAIGNIHILPGEKLFFEQLKTEEHGREKQKFTDSLRRSLCRFVMNQDIAKKVSDFFATKRNEVPFRYLTVEQLYLFAYGLLNGLNTEKSTGKALNILESLINLYCSDDETERFKGVIAYDLMMYFININEIDRALQFGDKAISCNYIEAANYLGQLYRTGEFVGKDKEKALKLFMVGAEQNNISSIRLAIDLLHQNCGNNHNEQLQTYYEKAALYGDEWDFLRLMSFYWNIGKYEEIKLSCKTHNKPEALFEDILRRTEAQSDKGCMRILKTEYRKDFDNHILMCEILCRNRKFQLYKKRTGKNTSDVFLVRDNKDVIYTENCVWGYGECPTFDMWEEDGLLFLKISDFDHYEIETQFLTLCLFNPLSENIVSTFSYSEWIKFRHDLTCSAYIS